MKNYVRVYRYSSFPCHFLLYSLCYAPLFLLISCSSSMPRTYSDYYFSSGVPENSGFTLYDVRTRKDATNRADVTHSKGGGECIKLFYEKTNLILTAATFVSPKGNYTEQQLLMRDFDLHDVAINDLPSGDKILTFGRKDIDGFTVYFTFKQYDGKFLIPFWEHPYYKKYWMERQKQKNANVDKKSP